MAFILGFIKKVINYLIPIMDSPVKPDNSNIEWMFLSTDNKLRTINSDGTINDQLISEFE